MRHTIGSEDNIFASDGRSTGQPDRPAYVSFKGPWVLRLGRGHKIQLDAYRQPPESGRILFTPSCAVKH